MTLTLDPTKCEEALGCCNRINRELYANPTSVARVVEALRELNDTWPIFYDGLNTIIVDCDAVNCLILPPGFYLREYYTATGALCGRHLTNKHNTITGEYTKIEFVSVTVNV
jgi:hypothetical protein